MASGKRSKTNAKAMGPGSVRFSFRSFKRLLEANTRALESMAQMERALGGEYVFDKAFLESSVREVCRLTHLSVYHLNGMSGEGFVALYDAFLSVKDSLEDILSGGMGPLSDRSVLPFDEIGWETQPLVGFESAGLAVLGRGMGLPAPDGFSVTATGMRRLAGPEKDRTLDEVEEGVRALFTRLGGPRRLELTLSRAGEGGDWGVLSVILAESPEQAADAVLSMALSGADRTPGAADGAFAPLAVCVRPHVAGPVIGMVQTLAHDPNLPPAMLMVAESPEYPGLADRFWISRNAPHDPLRTRLSAKPLDASLPGGKALEPFRGWSLRGSAWLTPDKSSLLAELGLATERAMGGPGLLSWTLSDSGAVTITGLEPARAAFPEWPQEMAPGAALSADEPGPLLSGGQMACGGVGAGPVVLLTEDTTPESVPLGSVGAARAASPALSRIVPRLGALLAEVGGPASHLATVARENRVPALFGLTGAASLTPGALVTVDAEAAAVYPGVMESLLRQAAVLGEATGADPEYQVLRRLLRHIRPLNLVDPQADAFRPENCRTCHDIIHFAHEKSVDLLLDVDASRGAETGGARRLRGCGPFEFTVVDLGGALSVSGEENVQTGDIDASDVTSLPLKAFLEGLSLESVQRQGPARLRLGDIFAGMGRTSQAASGSGAANLVLAARDYANITLRLGYHFSVIDAAVSDRPEHTFVYFRYAGGFADTDRRRRRAVLILGVLERLGFLASRQGDLVVGKRKLMEREEALAVLGALGALSAFTRQLDVELVSEDEAKRFARMFLEACGLDASSREVA